MRRGLDHWCAVAALLALAALAFPLRGGAEPLAWADVPLHAGVTLAFAAICAWLAWTSGRSPLRGLGMVFLVVLGGASALDLLGAGGVAGQAATGFWLWVFALWAAAWRGIDQLAAYRGLDRRLQRATALAVPMAFGCWLVFLWEVATVGFGVPQVPLPQPST